MSTSIFTDPNAYADFDGWHATAAELRRSHGLVRVEDDGFMPFWAAVHLADIRAIGRAKEIFHNAPHPILVSGPNREGGGPPIRNLVGMDDDEHATYRSIIADWFLPKTLNAREAEIRTLARQHIDDLALQNGSIDFANVVSCGLPLRFILSTLGVPARDDLQLHEWTEELFGADDAEIAGASREQTIARVVQNFGQYFMGMTERLRKTPDDSLGSVIANAQIEGAAMTPDLLVPYFILLATAGHDTVATVLAGGIEALARNPGELEKLQRNPELIPMAIEEMVRWVTPTKHFMRTAVTDTQLHGEKIAAGDWLLLSFASANRDEAVFDKPFEFNVTRSDARQHVGFGFGPHICVGMTLARLQLRCFFEELIPRIRLLEPDGDASYSSTTFVSTFKSLPLKIELTTKH